MVQVQGKAELKINNHRIPIQNHSKRKWVKLKVEVGERVGKEVRVVVKVEDDRSSFAAFENAARNSMY